MWNFLSASCWSKMGFIYVNFKKIIKQMKYNVYLVYKVDKMAITNNFFGWLRNEKHYFFDNGMNLEPETIITRTSTLSTMISRITKYWTIRNIWCEMIKGNESHVGKYSILNFQCKLLVHSKCYIFIQTWKKYTLSPRFWNIPVLVNTGTFLVYQYCPKI